MSGVEITQADRVEAAEVLGMYESMGNRQRTLDGSLDMHPVPEAFARHRQSATAPLIAALEEARDALKPFAAARQYSLDNLERAQEALTRITAELAKHKGNSDG